MSNKPLLHVENLGMRFGGLAAISDVSFTAQDKQITAVIGPNGAGKTTLFNCLTGFYRPTSGQLTVTHSGQSFALQNMKNTTIARTAKVARTFQNIRLFPRMSALENLLVAQHHALMKASSFLLGGLLGLGRYRRAERQAIDKAAYWLDKLNLTPVADVEAGTLPYGIQRRVEIARALCTEPKLLCLDEPVAGLNPRESADLAAQLAFLRSDVGIGILLIEHDMSVVMGISDHVVVLDYGRKIAEGPPTQVRQDPRVIKAYLGEEDDHADR